LEKKKAGKVVTLTISGGIIALLKKVKHEIIMIKSFSRDYSMSMVIGWRFARVFLASAVNAALPLSQRHSCVSRNP